MLPAMLFGLLIVLTPLALDDAGWGTFAIAAVFFAAGLVEVVLNPLLGRYSDRAGRLLPIRVGARGVDRRRGRAGCELGAALVGAARLRRVDQLRQPLHAGNVVDLAPGGDRRGRAGTSVRRHEHGVGAGRGSRARPREERSPSLQETRRRT